MISVIGDSLLDRYVDLAAGEWDTGIAGRAYTIQRCRTCPGGAANVAMNVRSHGTDVFLATVFGEGAAGSSVRQLLHRGGVVISDADIDPEFRTPVLTRLSGLEGSPDVRIDQQGGWQIQGRKVSGSHWFEMLSNSTAAVVADYGEVMHAELAIEVVEVCGQLKLPLVVDPSRGSADWYRGATAFKLNTEEALRTLGHEHEDIPASRLALDLCSEFDLQFAVVTTGRNGGCVALRNGDVHHATGCSTAINSTGGGDSVAACLAVCLAQSHDVFVALDRAVEAGDRSVSSRCTCPAEPCISDPDWRPWTIVD